MPEERQSTAEWLDGQAEWLIAQAKDLREDAANVDLKAARLRTQADALELEAVEARAAANILRQAGLRVERTPEGVPLVEVDRVLAEPIEAA